MVPRPPGSNRTDTLFPDTTLCRSLQVVRGQGGADRLIALDSPLAHGGARDHGRGTPVRRFVAGLMPTPAVRSGQPRTHSRECGRQPAHQSLITDVLQVPPPPVCVHPTSAALRSGRSRTPDPLTTDIRALSAPHLPIIGELGRAHV